MARTLCSEMALQDLTVLASSRNTKGQQNIASLPWPSLLPDLNPIGRKRVGQARLTCFKPGTSCIKTIVNFARLYCISGTGFHVLKAHLIMKMCQVVIRQWEGYTQHKPKVVDYYEPFRDFLHQILKVYAPKRTF